jgi:hypothetical protein
LWLYLGQHIMNLKITKLRAEYIGFEGARVHYWFFRMPPRSLPVAQSTPCGSNQALAVFRIKF